MERLMIKVAVYMLLIKENKVFLLRRFNTGWEDGNYTLASGHLESEETLVEAMIREVKEEIGIFVKEEDVVFAHTTHRTSHIDFYFTALAWDGEPKNMEVDKCDDAQWFPLDALPENMAPSVRFAIENYKKGMVFSEFRIKG